MHQLTIEPVLHPCGTLIVVVDKSFALLKKRLIHKTLGRGDFCHYAILKIALVLLTGGNTIVKLVVAVLSEPKSKTATDLSPLVEL